MYIIGLLIAIFFDCTHSSLVLGTMSDFRSLEHSVGEVSVQEKVNYDKRFITGACKFYHDRRVVKVAFFTGRFYPHYVVVDGEGVFSSAEEAYSTCIKEYQNLKVDVLYDLGLAVIVLADFARDLGVTLNRNPIGALEYLINTEKKKLDDSDHIDLKIVNPDFVSDYRQYLPANADDVHFPKAKDANFDTPKDINWNPPSNSKGASYTIYSNERPENPFGSGSQLGYPGSGNRDSPLSYPGSGNRDSPLSYPGSGTRDSPLGNPGSGTRDSPLGNPGSGTRDSPLGYSGYYEESRSSKNKEVSETAAEQESMSSASDGNSEQKETVKQ